MRHAPNRKPDDRASGPGRDRRRPRGAFTLVELLTAVAIVGVLATLLLTALGSAQKKSRLARCTANLHQLSLALNMYMDDFDQRLRQLGPLAQARYLPSREVLLCPADRTGNWGGLLAGEVTLALPPGGDWSGPMMTPSAVTGNDPTGESAPLPRSYLLPLPWDDESWNRLLKAGSQAGLAVCQLHGLGRPNLAAPSALDFEGLILRAQRDGAVVRRHVFWADMRSAVTGGDFASLNAATPQGTTLLLANSPLWPLFSDEPAPADDGP
jgi:prepilin-type N-terminal cleavage/methylation domain-containing protein